MNETVQGLLSGVPSSLESRGGKGSEIAHTPLGAAERTAGQTCPAFNADTPEAQRAREIAGRNFNRLSKLTLQPFAYCFRDKNRHEIDSVVAEMLGLDPKDQAIQEMLAHYRLLFASEPNVNGRQKSIVAALEEYQTEQ